MKPFDLIKRLLDRGGSATSSAQAAQPMQGGRAPLIERRRDARIAASAGLRVLIIDDSPTIVAILGKMLRSNGFVTAGAGDAETGIEQARAERPDLIFLDIVLPGMSGFNALRELRRDAATRDIPIIMISGNVQATEQFYVQRIGADDFMRKPFGRGDVFARIQRLVESGRLPSHAAPTAELLRNDGDIAPPDPSDAGASTGLRDQTPAG